MRRGAYKTLIPQTGNSGSEFFPAIEANFEKLDGHEHDGIDSAVIPSTNVGLVKQTLPATWTPYGSGYRQIVTVPQNKKYSEFIVIFKDVAGNQLWLDTSPVAGDEKKFYVHCNDATLSVIAHYVS